MRIRFVRQRIFRALVLAAAVTTCSLAFADDHVRGVITEHGSDGTLTLQTEDASTVIVVVDDGTKVRRVDGARLVKVSSATLIPGLRVKLHGRPEGSNRFNAHRITFSKADYRIARSIAPTDMRSRVNQQRIERNAAVIAEQQATLGRQARQIATNNEQINYNAEKIVATTGALAATNTRIADLDNYEIVSSMNVYFPNGKASIAKKSKTELEEFAARAKGGSAYKIQVQGFASAIGGAAINDRLSMQRADAVASVLQQSGVPLTNIVVPAAMGTTNQVASNKTMKGQAQNRRTVVTLLRSKAVANH
jgi:outer membrane protein OmpA-like peptidoglycan-associated protein